MLRLEVIGNLGANVEKKQEQGRTFYTFRVANTDKWTDANGNVQTETTWVDCSMSNISEKLLPYLKQGQKVFVRGNVRLRVYSSKKDRCMKAGASMFVNEIDLIGGEPDPMPRQVVDPETGTIYDVAKYAKIECTHPKWKKDEVHEWLTPKGQIVLVNKDGWIAPKQDSEQGAEDKNLQDDADADASSQHS